MASVQEPVESDGGRPGEKVYEHPAYGQIHVGRISGGAVLYGSDFRHHGFVRIEIGHSVLHRDLSHDWPYARNDIISVDMTEAQWATMVSSLNIGSGVQCTIARLNGEAVPGLPAPIDTTEQFKREAKEKIGRAMESLTKLRSDVASGDIVMSGKLQRAMLERIDTVKRELEANLPWVAQVFGEHMQRRAEKAKIEVMAWMQRTIQRTGIAALQKAEAPLEIEGPKDRDAA